MKKFKCAECGKELGDMNKGRLLKNAVLYCSECDNQRNKIITAVKLSKLSEDSNNNKDTFKDFMKGIGL